MTRISYERKPNEPFEDERVEVYARCRASNATQRESAKEAGISTSTAHEIEKEPAFQMRVAELKADRRRFTGVTLAAIMQKFWQNAQDAADAGEYAASNQALKELVSLVKEDMARGGIAQHMQQIGMRKSERAISEGRRERLRSLLSGETQVAEQPRSDAVEVMGEAEGAESGLPD